MRKTTKKLRRGTCRVCGCTHFKPCVDDMGGTCAWANREETLCSSCALKEMIPRQARRRILLETSQGKLIEVRDAAGVTRCEWKRVLQLVEKCFDIAREEDVSVHEILMCMEETLI